MMYSKDAPLIFFNLLAIVSAVPSTIRGHQGDDHLVLDVGGLVSDGKGNRGSTAHSVAKLLASGSSGATGTRWSIVGEGWWGNIACLEVNDVDVDYIRDMARTASARIGFLGGWKRNDRNSNWPIDGSTIRN